MSDSDPSEDTLAGRRQPLKQPPTLAHREGASYLWDPAEERTVRTGQLRVVNESREGLGSEASVPVDNQSSSSLPNGWSLHDLADDYDRKARWEETTDSKQGKKNAAPLSFHEQAIDILVKIRLLPIMKCLQDTGDKEVLAQVLKRAKAVLAFAIKEGGSGALQGCCCYYIGVAMHLLNNKDAPSFFIRAMDAKGVYEEGRWAQQWTNHYENVAELSPKRIAISERPVSFPVLSDRPTSWYGKLFSLMGNGSPKREEHNGSVKISEQEDVAENGNVTKRVEVLRELPEPGVQITTPVKQRFSLDARDDTPVNTRFGTDDASNKPDPSIVGGEPIPSFSSWRGSESSNKASSTLTKRREIVIDIDGSHSPKSAPVLPSDQGGRTSINLESPQFAPRHVRSKSVTFSSTPLESDNQKPGTLRQRRQSSILKTINTGLQKVRELSISPTKSSEHLMEAGQSPGYESSQRTKAL